MDFGGVRGGVRGDFIRERSAGNLVLRHCSGPSQHRKKVDRRKVLGGEMVPSWHSQVTVIMGQTSQQVCVRRILTVAIFLLPWAICNAAPYQLADHKNGHWSNDTVTGTSSVTRKKHHSHMEGKHAQGCKHDHSTSSRRHHRDRYRNNPHRHLSRDNEVVPLRSNDDILNNIPTYVSDLVVFSPVKPANPPWSPEAVLRTEANEVTDRHHRERRSTTQGEPYRAVCEPDPGWVKKTWVYDLFGNNVTVINEITTSDGMRAKQWFFQTTCKRTQGATEAPQPCAGIDSRLYESECEEKRSFVYAVVRTDIGEEGWQWVIIPTSCNCAFRPVRNPRRRAWPPAYSSTDTQTQPTIIRDR
ncbi:neurotrophin-3-like isoform X2 [Acanthaster planci]|nr:neurotrophin-3-like isoform X2 [Acanthaster planci]XP_022105963.1 neurotrophin-3-like isoform X2 [Acanthaster planci]